MIYVFEREVTRKESVPGCWVTYLVASRLGKAWERVFKACTGGSADGCGGLKLRGQQGSAVYFPDVRVPAASILDDFLAGFIPYLLASGRAAREPFPFPICNYKYNSASN